MKTTTRDAQTVRDGDYWLTWSSVPEGQEPSEDQIDEAKLVLRDRGLRLCNDDEGLLVTSINDVD